MKRRLFHVNAFCAQPFRGNPAGVLLQADGMSTAEMQAWARELKHSETAFVLAPEGPDHDLRIRYFTPSTEVPLCGHATVAAHAARAAAWQLPDSEWRQKTAAGIQRVRLSTLADGRRRVTLWQGRPSFEVPLAAPLCEHIAGALGLQAQQLKSGWPVQIVSTGHSKVLIPLADAVDLDGLRPDLAALTALSAELACNGFFVFQCRPEQAGQPGASDGRMFAPAIGIAEDPVTGNANGPLGAYLVQHRLMAHDGQCLRLQGHQGRALQRDGVVHVQVQIETDGSAGEVSIAGDSCILFSAEVPGC
ncbi:PhzF family isomerase [Paucibacter sp. APW11]|uniref:PhzF family isomerase n=1 Tax=Roseateles aquae TaxID=3077235 RepID=A0ABU3PHR4_9BURK|nr:PhzF family isomerase [Paucibacter sp. APW11]MDT9001917.1 PhzF family isomerase [Paucibacter sp. APW11]